MLLTAGLIGILSAIDVYEHTTTAHPFGSPFDAPATREFFVSLGTYLTAVFVMEEVWFRGALDSHVHHEGESLEHSPRAAHGFGKRVRVRHAAYRASASSDGPTRCSSQEFRGLDARRKPTNRSFALRVPSHAPTGHCFQLMRPL